MNLHKLIRLRDVTTWLWLLLPVVVVAPSGLTRLGLQMDYGIYFILVYFYVCWGFAFKLQRAKCPQCEEYMFRRGKMKFALQKFIFRRCGHCGYKLTREAGGDRGARC